MKGVTKNMAQGNYKKDSIEGIKKNGMEGITKKDGIERIMKKNSMDSMEGIRKKMLWRELQKL